MAHTPVKLHAGWMNDGADGGMAAWMNKYTDTCKA
jgi:hypothetical protein